MVTDVGPVAIAVPRDRAGSFEPQVVAKRQRRLSGVDDLVLSLSAKGLTHGEICAHLAEVYGTEVSKQTISTITDAVIAGMSDWQSRPLDAVHPVIFVEAIHVKIRDGQVANRPIYVALAVTADGHRDILGLLSGYDLICTARYGTDAQPGQQQPSSVQISRTRWRASRMRAHARSPPARPASKAKRPPA